MISLRFSITCYCMVNAVGCHVLTGDGMPFLTSCSRHLPPRSWRRWTIGRLRFKLMVAGHLHSGWSGRALDLCFRAWRQIHASKVRIR